MKFLSEKCEIFASPPPRIGPNGCRAVRKCAEAAHGSDCRNRRRRAQPPARSRVAGGARVVADTAPT